MFDKLKSRKFIAFIIWTALVGISIVITEAIIPELIAWYGAVTMIYLGSNIATKYLYKDK